MMFWVLDWDNPSAKAWVIDAEQLFEYIIGKEGEEGKWMGEGE